MAFSISYEGLTRGNIRHIYSYRAADTFVPTPRPFGKTTQFLPQPLVQRYPPRFYDYYPAFDIGLPRAPAFDRRSADQVREMLERIQKPIACQRERGRGERSKGQTRSRPKEKVVRFQNLETPPPQDGSKDAKVDYFPYTECDSFDKVEVKVGSEEKGNGVKGSSSDIKDKEEESSKMNDRKREQPKKQTVRHERKKKTTSLLPPINN
ncbi:hypothetical protein ACOMHN_049769 [Nucella lapillus]